MTDNSDGSRSGTIQRTGIEREFAEQDALESELRHEAETWREEVANRVNRYRVRKSKKTLAGQFSMKLDFEERPPRQSATAAAPPVAAPAPPVMPPAPPAMAPAAQVTAPAPPVAPAVSTPAAARTVPSPAASRAASAAPAWQMVSTEQALRAEVVATAPAAAVQPEPKAAPAPREERETKIIEFPRALMFPEEAASAGQDPNELAEPMPEASSALDVADTVSVAAPELADIALDSELEEQSASRPEFDLPLQVAPLPHRFSAVLLDSMLVLGATAVFNLIVWFGAHGLPHTRPVLGLAAVMPVVFWTVYHLLFLTYSLRTPGMLMAGLRISSFSGRPAPRRMRRWRALMMLLSGASLGFGFLWAFFDQDYLGWHDRMTRTYLTLENHQS